MVFADDERKSNPTGFAFLQAAHMWKQRQAQAAQSGGGSAVANLVAAARPEAVVEDEQIESSSDEDMADGANGANTHHASNAPGADSSDESDA